MAVPSVRRFPKMLVLKICIIVWYSFCSAKDLEPKFLGPGINASVVVGRDALLTCKVQNLQNYKVAWLRVDTQTILTIGGHVITKNHRVSVTAGDPQVWVLSIRDVRPADGGQYMCQVNTEPMITQTHLLYVFVPPDITESGSSSEMTVREGEDVSLRCAASGVPPPTITWRRENGAAMMIHTDLVNKWSGQWLNITNVKREMNAALLCIATNGVPPSVSKRVLLHVLCKPTTRVVQKMVGGYIGSTVVLQCKIEANPPPFVYWTHVIGKKLQNGTKYQAHMKSQSYKHTGVLIIHELAREDIGAYYCHAENSLGGDKDDVTLYTLATTTITTTTVTTVATTTTPVATMTTPLATSTTLLSTPAVVTSTELYNQTTEFINPFSISQEEIHEKDNLLIVSQHRMQKSDSSQSS